MDMEMDMDMDPADFMQFAYGPWEQERINDKLVVFMRKRLQDHLCAERLWNYVEVQRKLSKAAMSRRRSAKRFDASRGVIDNCAENTHNYFEEAVTKAVNNNDDEALEQERESYEMRKRGKRREQTDRCRRRRRLKRRRELTDRCRAKPTGGGRRRCGCRERRQRRRGRCFRRRRRRRC